VGQIKDVREPASCYYASEM